MYSLKHISEITSGKFVGIIDYKPTIFLTDSRTLQNAADTLFIALKTQRNNGHNYIHDLIKKGVTSFLIEEHEFDISSVNNTKVSFIISKNPLQSLQQLAAYHRSQFTIPVIGITGSNGKTVVKEWLYQLLKSDYTICRSPKSFNSQIGVPLSVMNLNASHTLAIFEAGISQPDEMDKLEKIIQPTLGIITSIGTAHDEGFENKDNKISEKLKLVTHSKNVIINGVEKNNISPTLFPKTIFVSTYNDADLQFSFSENTLHLKAASKNYSFHFNFTDSASIANGATCVAVLLHLGYSEETIQQKLNQLQAIALRLEIKTGINNSLLINDYYNSDLDSLTIALSFLQQQHRRAKKIVIISDIEQSGVLAANLYKQLADLFSQTKVDLVVGIGKDISANKPLFKNNSLFFLNTESFIQHFSFINHQFYDATILLKGARSFGFENISRLLQQKSHDTVFEVNLNKLTSNVNYFKSLIEPKTKIMAMVKAMGYGSGSSDIAKTLEHIGVNYLAVAYTDEGVELRNSQIKLPIMVMSPETDSLDDIINFNLEPEIYSFRVLHEFIAKLDQLGISEPYPVHLKIDTGMHRLGFEEKDIPQLISELKKYAQLKITSIFSHLSASDNPELDEFTKQQIHVFETISSTIENEIGYATLKHICNSGAISRFKHAHFNMVRLGIGMYGLGVNEQEQKQLENVGTLKTKISQIKFVPQSETIGYNRNGKITSDTFIATIPIGYADGFSRQLGNGKHGVFINGQFCKTIGNICMDMCMIKVTGVNCKEGDEVIIFENTEQINALATALNTINYEVLTSVSSRVKRVYIQE
ncbi:MAG: bifunctional UDP-N-acetylmuramoyl-tripeptide:D-alanyl-D-alanine ligase/alanine racemase [Bacteroidota bacterium]|nr:bifunctional UDP-N-acetylmuramoyl-tripeptide:D-alanyl-D-alanine ligase/alanine racemase [Bacteroidota bacterium]